MFSNWENEIVKQRVAQLLIAQYDSSNSMYGLTLRMIFSVPGRLHVGAAWTHKELYISDSWVTTDFGCIWVITRVIPRPHCSFPLSVEASLDAVLMFMRCDNSYNMQITYEEQVLC